MSKTKKQTAVEWLVNEIESKGEAWENASIRKIQISIDVSDYLELKRQAKAMEKEQIIDAHDNGYIDGGNRKSTTAEQYYNETYNND